MPLTPFSNYIVNEQIRTHVKLDNILLWKRKIFILSTIISVTYGWDILQFNLKKPSRKEKRKKKYVSQNKNIVYNRLFVVIQLYPRIKNITLQCEP